MRYVLCLLDPTDRGLPQEVRQQYDALPRRRGLEFTWRTFDHAAVLTAWDDPWGDPLVVHQGDWIAVGAVRLDNRAEVERWTGLDRASLASLTDLALVLRVVAASGTRRVRDILGDFAFAVWDAGSRRAIAAADALGVKKLFYTERRGRVAFATRAEALVLEERYEAQYLTELIALCPLTPGLTAFEGVRRLPSGVCASLQVGDLTERTYWSPEEFDTVPFTPALEREAPEQLRAILSESVKQRLTQNADTWAQLSGGIDSSSIVSLAQWLEERGEVKHGVVGTVTFVDCQDTEADEREYSDAVTKRWQVPNAIIVDPPLWVDDGIPPHNLDSPLDSLAFSPRERRLITIVRRSGGRVLLAGFGSDELFTGTPLAFSDWVARGRVLIAVRTMAEWAARGRVSFWQVAYGNALLPLVPRWLRRPSAFDDGRVLPWVEARAVQRYRLRGKTHSITDSRGNLGGKYRAMLVKRLRAIMTQLDSGALSDALEVRYPFLSRHLAELALRLPPELCLRPHARKWVLREAMRGILPDAVRTRVGKGSPTSSLARSLAQQRTFLLSLLNAPVLAELGIVNPEELRAVLEQPPRAVANDRYLGGDAQVALMVEAWLRLRVGRWPPGPSL